MATGIEVRENNEEQTKEKKTVQGEEVKEEKFDINEFYSDTKDTAINFKNVFNSLSTVSSQIYESILFAYYLYKRNLIKVIIKGNYVLYDRDVCFCNSAKLKIKDSDKESLLEKLHTYDLFPSNGRRFLTSISKSDCENIATLTHGEFCSKCSGRDNRNNLSCCPYALAAVIVAFARNQGFDADKVFRLLLGEKRTPFDNEKEFLSIPVNPDDIKGIESKSAYAAYLMLRDGFIRSSVVDDSICYSAIRLCDYGDKTPKIKKILNFWKSKSCTERTMSKDLYDKKINESTCKTCFYKQCPERLAAYFDYLSFDYDCSPIDLAYYVANHNTYCHQSACDDRQYNVYISKIMRSSLNDEDKEDCCKIVNYITSKSAARRKNMVERPVLPINIAIKCKDLPTVEKFIHEVFVQVTWYNNYFDVNRDNYRIVSLDLSGKETEDIIDFYENAKEGNIVLITNISGAKINNCYSLIKKINEKEKSVITFVVDEEEIIDEFFRKYPKLQMKIFNKIYTFNDLNSKTVSEEILSLIEETLDVSDNVQILLKRYVDAMYAKSGKESTTFIKETYEDLIFRHFSNSLEASEYLEEKDIPSLEPKRTKEEIFKELDELTGLDDVKLKLREIASLVEFDLMRNKNGRGHQSMHMIFNGNPGTGKTTVARLTAEILYSIGFIQENKLVQCSAKDLIGEYLGQTGPKTAKKCEEAYNGVLFIDEAYQLNPYSSGGQSDMYKEECVAELIQQMENNRDRLVVIFAGYTDEMNEFLEKANTGLKSRLQQTIEFPDYTVDELVEIFSNICRKEEIEIGENGLEKLTMIFKQAKGQPGSKFGNARYVRNVFDKSFRVHAVNCSNIENTPENHEKLFTLTVDEITAVN